MATNGSSSLPPIGKAVFAWVMAAETTRAKVGRGFFVTVMAGITVMIIKWAVALENRLTSLENRTEDIKRVEEKVSNIDKKQDRIYTKLQVILERMKGDDSASN